MAQLYDRTDYRSYLASALDELGRSRKGIRSRFAEFLDVKPGYVSHILAGRSHLSIEQAGKTNTFFGHTDEQSFYFILLVEHERTSSSEVRDVLLRQIRSHQRDFLNMKKKFARENTLTGEDKNVYYSSWQFTAVFVALTVPSLRTKEALSRHFGLPLKRISEIIQFLISTGLAMEEKGELVPTRNSVHLSGDPINLSRYHMNWRLASIRAYESQGSDDVFYTSVISLSEADAFRIKRKLLAVLDEARAIVRDSKEEKVCSLLLDFFEI